jgi:hypothetical protein
MSTLQVDKIIPYQSSSVTVEGLSAPNLATTGSNTFVGNQNIQGTITASIQEGFALVGGVGNVSTLAATSSFGGSGFPFTGDAVITGSLTISGSAANDLEVIGGIRVSSGSANTTVTPLGVNSGGSGTITNRIGMFSNPSLANLGALTTVTQPSIVVNRAAPPFTTQAIEFTNGTTIGLKLPVEITGSLSISGSNTIDLVVNGRQSIIGPTTGDTPQLIVSSSDFTNTIGRGSITISGSGAFTPGFAVNSPSSSANLSALGFTVARTGAGGVGGAIDFGNYLAVSTGDASELTLAADAAQYTVIGNWTGPAICSNSPSDGYPAIIGFQNKSTWTDGRPTFLTPVDVSGSVNITDVLKLAQKDPLPTGGVGQLAVSASNLYYHNGSSWTQIN